MLKIKVRRGVAVIGHVPFAAGQSPDEPSIDGAEKNFAALGPIAQSFMRIEKVLDFAAGKVGVDQQSGFRAEKRLQPSAFSRSHTPELTRLCQTTALAAGRPVARSQRMVVSR